MRARRAVLTLPLAAAAAGAIAIGGASASAGSHLTAAAACTLNDVALTYKGTEGAAGTQIENFRYTKRGAGTCSMGGFPKVELLKKSGAALAIKVRRSHNRKVRTLGLRKGKPLAFELAHPSFDPDTSNPCSTKVQGFRVRAPGIPQKLTLKLSSPLKFCLKGAKRTALGRPR
jgi:Protein of unknown function (DUF4232)